MTEPEEVLVIQTLQIVDKNAKKKTNSVARITEANFNNNNNRYERVEDNLISHYDVHSGHSVDRDSAVINVRAEGPEGAASCVEETSIFAGAIVFVVVQVF